MKTYYVSDSYILCSLHVLEIRFEARIAKARFIVIVLKCDLPIPPVPTKLAA